MQISRIRLSDKISRLHPRRAAATLGQAYEPEVPVEVREWIRPASASPDLVFGPQPPAQPHGCVAIERAIRCGIAGAAACLVASTTQTFRRLHACSGCFRLERLPGGACTHWKAPPCHGAHPERPLPSHEFPMIPASEGLIASCPCELSDSKRATVSISAPTIKKEALLTAG